MKKGTDTLPETEIPGVRGDAPRTNPLSQLAFQTTDAIPVESENAMKKLRITVGKKTYDVTVEVLSEDPPAAARGAAAAAPLTAAAPAAAPTASAASAPAAASGAGAVVSPMAGTVKSIAVKEGDEVAAGDVVAVLEAMKMENKITAHKAGTISAVKVEEGESVQDGQELVTIE